MENVTTFFRNLDNKATKKKNSANLFFSSTLLQATDIFYFSFNSFMHEVLNGSYEGFFYHMKREIRYIKYVSDTVELNLYISLLNKPYVNGVILREEHSS